MDLTHTILHENRWVCGKTIHVVSCYGEAIVEMSFPDDNAGACYISGLSVTQPIRNKGVAVDSPTRSACGYKWYSKRIEPTQ